MEVNGREVGFRRTVYATCEIAKKCPKQDLNRLQEVFTKGDYASQMEMAAVIMTTMSHGYEMAKHYSDSTYEMKPLTTEEVMLLDIEVFTDLFASALKAFEADGKTTVEAEPVKGKNAVRDGE